MIIDLRDIPVMYINLKHDTYRNKRCIEELQKFGFTNISRIEGIKFENHHFKGCALAHNNALSALKPPFIIVEDDIVIKNLEPIINVPEDADAVYLGISQWGKTEDDFGENLIYKNIDKKIVKIKNMLSAHAILYLKKDYVNFCKDLTFTSSISGVPHDHGFADIQNVNNVYAVKDPLFFQKSQIECTYQKIGEGILPNRKKICIINIATNKYIKFIEPLWKSINSNFLKNCVVESLLFTNHDIEPITSNGKVSKIEHEPFPTPTLMRYHYINSESEYLKQFDYCFYLDADMLIENKVEEEILGDLVATIHPGFFNKNINDFAYERNENSMAYIPIDNGNKYYAGGFNGGVPEKFLEMSKTIANNIDIDKLNNIIAVWHDESHFNRYLLDNPPTLELNPDYCYPESWNIPFERKILALDKNHEEVRS